MKKILVFQLNVGCMSGNNIQRDLSRRVRRTYHMTSKLTPSSDSEGDPCKSHQEILLAARISNKKVSKITENLIGNWYGQRRAVATNHNRKTA